MAMTTLVSSASQADSATTLSAAVAFLPSYTVNCSCVNGVGQPTTPCKVELMLSIDGTNYVSVDKRWFGMAPSQTYWETFKLADYAGASQFRGADNIDRANASGTTQWADFKVNFYNNTGAAVTIFCQYG